MIDYKKEAKITRTVYLAKFCVATGKVLFIGSMNPDWWYARLTKELPGIKLTKTLHGVRIEKS